jgi:NADH-quinone oxidoreductase subunit K
MSVGLNHYLVVSGVLFAIGFFGVLLRKNVIFIFMCIELMLTAVNVMLIAFSKFNGVGDGLIFVFFTITVAAAEVAIGLAIIVALYKKRQTIMVDEINQLKN